MKKKIKKYLYKLSFFKQLPKELLNKIIIVGGLFPSLYYTNKANDVDFIVEDLDEFKFQLENYFNRTFHLLEDKRGNKIVRFKFGKTYYDIFAIEKNLQYDAKRRDFTINSIYYSFKDDKIIDYLNGLYDIKSGILRYSSPKFLELDPIRYLRYFRFLSQYQLTPDKNTEKIINSFSLKALNKIASERIIYELKKLFYLNNSFSSLLEMEKKQFISFLFPPFSTLKGINQNKFHSFDIYKHSLYTYKWVEYYQKYYDYYDFSFELKMAALFHDIGKVKTRTIDEKGNIHFYGHESIGAQIIKELLESVPLSKKEKKMIINLVENHMFLANLKFSGRDITLKNIRKFMYLTNRNYMPHIILFLADGAAAHDIPDKKQEKFAKNFMIKLIEYNKMLEKKRKKILSGNDLIAIGFSPGEFLGKTLHYINEEYFSGHIQNREEALKIAKKILKKIITI